MQKADFGQKINNVPQPSEESASNQSISDQINPKEIWKILKEQLRLWHSPKIFNTWYEGFYLDKIEDGIAEFSCETNSKRNWIEENSRAIIKKALKESTGQKLDILITVRSSIDKNEESEPDNAQEIIQNGNDISNQSQFNNNEAQIETNYEYYDPRREIKLSGSGNSDQTSIFDSEAKKNTVEYRRKEAYLSSNYTLDSFIVGNNCRLAYAVAEAVTENPGKAYNPVFYYGGTGLGKTHLMHAIGNKVLEKSQDMMVLYTPIERFLNEMLMSIRNNSMHEFKNKYRKIDVLILDDVQAISDWEKTQEELFNTFNSLYMAEKQIIMASDRPPQQIQKLTDRLRSRFEGGMVVDVKPPDKETRLAILQQVLNTRGKGLEIPHEYLSLIAENIQDNIRQLEGAMIKIISTVKLGKRVASGNPDVSGPIKPDGTEMTKDDILEILQIDIESKRKRIKPKDIIKAVSETFDVSIKEIKGKSRKAYIALARQVVMYLIREELDFPLEKVAGYVNRKDHTTVIHACDKIEEMLEDQEKFRDKISNCKALFL